MYIQNKYIHLSNQNITKMKIGKYIRLDSDLTEKLINTSESTGITQISIIEAALTEFFKNLEKNEGDI